MDIDNLACDAFFGQRVAMDKEFAVVVSNNCTIVYRYNTSNNGWNKFTILPPASSSSWNFWPESRFVDVYDNTIIIGNKWSENASIYEYDATSEEWNHMMQLSVSAPRSGSGTSGVIVDAAIHDRVIIVGAIVTVNYTINVGIPYLFVENQCKRDDDTYDYDYHDNHRWEQVLQLTTNDIFYEATAAGFWSKSSNVDIGKNFAIVGGSSGAYVFEYECKNSVNCSIDYRDMNFSYAYKHNYTYNYESNYSDHDKGCRVIQETKLIKDAICGVAISTSNTKINAMVCSYNWTNSSIYIFEYNKSTHRWIKTAKIAATRWDSDFGDIAISDNYALFGEYYDFWYYDEDNFGGTRLYQRNNSSNRWEQVAILLPMRSGWNRFFGTSAAINDKVNGYGNSSKTSAIVAGFSWIYDEKDAVYSLDVDDIARISNDNVGLGLKINYDYLTNMQIVGIDGEMLFSIDECEIDLQALGIPLSNANGLIFDATRFNGCFDVVFSDCDDSVTNDRTNRRGIYELTMNGTTIAYGGYYSLSESQRICTNNKYLPSYCTVPEYCWNNDNLQLDDQEIEVKTYQGILNSSLTSTSGYTMGFCSGDSSCQGSILLVKL